MPDIVFIGQNLGPESMRIIMDSVSSTEKASCHLPEAESITSGWCYRNSQPGESACECSV